MQHVLLAIFALGNLILALLIYRNNPKSWTNKLFTILLGIITVYLVVNSELYLIPGVNIKIFLSKLIISLGALINAAVFFFLVTFPQDEITIRNSVKYPIIVSSIALFFLGFTNFIFKDVQITPENLVIPEPGIGMPIFLIHTILTVLSGLIIIYLHYRKAKKIEKRKLSLVFLGFFVLFSLILIFNFLLVVFFKIGYFVPFLPIYVLVFNIIIAYAIVRHRVMEVRLVVARTVSYTLLIFILSSFYASMLFVLGRYLFPSQLNSDQFGISTALALVLAYTFQPLRKYIEHLTDRFLFKGRYDTQELLTHLNRLISVNIDLEDLIKKTIFQLKTNLRTEIAFVVLLESSGHTKINILGRDGAKSLYDLERYAQLFSANTKKILVFEELPENHIKQIMREYHIGVIVPLTFKHQYVGQLILGEKSSGDIYSDQDIQLLQILAPELAIAIQNARSFLEISNFNIRLKQEIKSATTDLREANKRLTELDKIKDEFLSIASHELRTPMTAIKSYLWMILNKSNNGDTISPKSRQYLDRAYLSTDRLLALVNDMLDVSRIEAGRIELHAAQLDLSARAKIALDELQSQATQRNITITLQSPAPKLVNADPDKLHQVFINLIGNAIKFTPIGGRIDISFTAEKNAVQTAISDTGKGISKKDLPKLFTKFGRLEGTLVSVAESGGTGLGLFICNQIIKKHGGQIWVESKLGKGSTFYFSLPTKAIF